MELRPPLPLGEVAIEKGGFGSFPTKVTNFTLRKNTSEKTATPKM